MCNKRGETGHCFCCIQWGIWGERVQAAGGSEAVNVQHCCWLTQSCGQWLRCAGVRVPAVCTRLIRHSWKAYENPPQPSWGLWRPRASKYTPSPPPLPSPPSPNVLTEGTVHGCSETSEQNTKTGVVLCRAAARKEPIKNRQEDSGHCNTVPWIVV